MYAFILAILIYNIKKKTHIRSSKYDELCAAARDRAKDQTNVNVHLEKQMFWKVPLYVFVPYSGLDENNIKGAFYPEAPLGLLYPVPTSSFKCFQQRNGPTYVSLLNKHFIWIFNL